MNIRKKEKELVCDWGFEPNVRDLFIIMVRDRAIKGEEHWVLATLDKDEAKKLYTDLGGFLRKD